MSEQGTAAPPSDAATAAHEALRDDFVRQGESLEVADVLRVVDRRNLTPEEEGWLWGRLRAEGLLTEHPEGTLDDADVSARFSGSTQPADGAAFGALMRELREVPKLTRRETAELVRVYQSRRVEGSAVSAVAAAAAADRLLRANLRFVVLVAKRHAHLRGLDQIDLIHEGVIGFLAALDRFDLERGTGLLTYASWWIQQAMSRGARDKGRTIRLPMHIHEKVGRVRRVMRHIERDTGQVPTVTRVADDLGMDPGKVAFLLDVSADTLSLDAPVDEGRELKLGDTIEDPRPTAEDAAVAESICVRVKSIVGELTRREQVVLSRRFGLGDCERQTLEEIGLCLHLTRERIRQIERKALEALCRKTSTRELWTSLGGSAPSRSPNPTKKRPKLRSRARPLRGTRNPAA